MLKLQSWKTPAYATLLTVISATGLGFTHPQTILKDVQSTLQKEVVRFKNWGITNDLKSDIRAVEAWKLSQGSHDVIVAVIDTGLDSNHPDLQGNIWSDAQSRNKTVYGWNYINNTANPNDDHGHGTHVAGIIGAIANPKTGVAGVAKQVSIMSVKYYSEKNSGDVNLRNTVKAIEYAVDHGARIINYSGGGPEFSEEEYLAIKKAEAKGVLFVAAAGNDRQNTDLVANYYYPSAYGLSNIISVAATDINNQMLKASNWGKRKVDVAAPGENIYSTLPGGKYGYMSGTSQATAFVSGLAALLLSKDPTLKAAELKELIRASVDRLPSLTDKVATGGRVNAYSALIALQNRVVSTKPTLVAATSPVKSKSLADLLSLP